MSSGYALGVEYVGDAPPEIGIFDPQLRTLLGLDLPDKRALLRNGELIVATQDGWDCRLHYSKHRAGAVWHVQRACPDDIAAAYPHAVWQAELRGIRAIEQLTLAPPKGAPQVHNYACEQKAEACNPWLPVTSAQDAGGPVGGRKPD